MTAPSTSRNDHDASSEVQDTIDVHRKRTERLSKESRAWRVYTEAELRPYRFFPQLYGERKYLKPFTGKPFPFLSLPTEVRVKIYQYHFIFVNGAIEFWPETDTGNHNYWVGQDQCIFLRNLFCKHQINLGFLRTCRLINQEGSQVFYGENTFRFSAKSGHMVANLFLRMIYKRHFRWLTTLTINMPLDGSDGKERTPYSDYTWQKFRHRIPFRVGSWFDSHTSFKELVETLLHGAVNLKKLILVLPHSFHYQSTYSQNYIWDAFISLLRENPDLKVAIIRMYNKREVLEEEWLTEAESWEQIGMPTQHAELLNRFELIAPGRIEVKGAYTDRRGRWKVIEGVPSEVFEEVGEDDDEATDEWSIL